MKHLVLNLCKPTPYDTYFYTRWNSIGLCVGSKPGHERETTVLVVDFRTTVTDEYLAQFPNLKLIVSPTTGQTHLQHTLEIPTLTLQGEVDFLKDIRSVCELTIKFMIDLSRPSDYIGRTLSGKTLGILGLGRIGKQVYDLAKAFNMTVIHVDTPHHKDQLYALFNCSDYVSIHCTENTMTQFLVNQDLIRSMKRGSYIINTARGSIVDEFAAVQAVRDGILGGYATDVVANESAFSNTKGLNVIVTPHIGGYTLEDRVRTDEFMMRKAAEFVGKWPSLLTKRPQPDKTPVGFV